MNVKQRLQVNIFSRFIFKIFIIYFWDVAYACFLLWFCRIKCDLIGLFWAIHNKNSIFKRCVYASLSSVCFHRQVWFSRPNRSLSFPFLSLSPHSGGGGRVGHDAGTDTWPLAGGGLPAQPGPAGGHLGHHAHWSTQVGRLPPAGHHAFPAAFPGEAGEEAACHQDRGGEEEEKRGGRRR